VNREALLIFDCDGVLVDSEIISLRIEVEELNRLGCSLTADQYLEAALGRHEEDLIWQSLAEAHGVALPADFAQTVRAKVAQSFEKELRPIDGVDEVLESLDLPFCVASSSRPDRLRRSLEITGLIRHFNGRLFSASQVSRGKPHPDLFLLAARSMRVSPARCLVIEDSPVGVQAAREAGMTALGFVGASHCPPSFPKRLRAAGAVEVFDEIRALPEFCRSTLCY
jgi:HAD superfamily hydrolase (TIGR01509 family)